MPSGPPKTHSSYGSLVSDVSTTVVVLQWSQPWLPPPLHMEDVFGEVGSEQAIAMAATSAPRATRYLLVERTDKLRRRVRKGDYANGAAPVMRIFTILLSFCSTDPKNPTFLCPKNAVRVLNLHLSNRKQPANVGCHAFKVMSRR